MATARVNIAMGPALELWHGYRERYAGMALPEGEAFVDELGVALELLLGLCVAGDLDDGIEGITPQTPTPPWRRWRRRISFPSWTR